MGYLPTVLRRRLVWILFTLAMLPQKGLTFSPVHNHQSSQPQGMSRRYNGGNTALSAAGSQNSNGRTWTSSDDLTVISSTMADLQDSQSVVSPTSLEIASGKAQPFSQAQRFISALDHPTLQMGRFLVLLASCIYGTNFTVVKLLDDTMPLSVSACLRFGLAASVVSALVLSREPDDVEPKLKKERNLAFWGGVEIGLWYCIGYIAQAEGLQTVAAGKSAFFNALAVVVVPILDVMFKSKILKPTEIASVLIACLGVGMLELGPEGGLTISSGDVLAFMQTIFFGIGYWRLESESHTHSDQAARLTIGQLSAVGVGSLFYAFTELGFGHLGISSFEQVIGWFEDPFIVGALLWTGLISTALALYLETVALKVVSASELTLLMTTTSLWGAGFAFVTLGEFLTPTGMFGGLLIMAGCALGNMTPGQPSKTVDESSMVLPLVTSFDSYRKDRSSSVDSYSHSTS